MDYDSYLENERIKNDLQEKDIFHYCDICSGEIYEGNEYYALDGYILCEDCYDEKIKEEKKDYRHIAGDDYE